MDVGSIYSGMMRWGTGTKVSVEGDQGLHWRVKARVYRLATFLISFSDVRKLRTSRDLSLVCTPNIQFTDSWKLRRSCGLWRYTIPSTGE